MSQTVLIVDDSKISRRINRELFVKYGYEVIGEANDGVEGFEKFQSLNPDIVVTDLEMPNLNGMGLIDKIRDAGSSVKIMVISSVVNTQITQAAYNQGAEVIKKPIKESVLQFTLHKLNEKD